MKIKELKNQIILKKSFLCVGLDVDLDLVPKFFLKFEDPLFEFSKKNNRYNGAFCCCL